MVLKPVGVETISVAADASRSDITVVYRFGVSAVHFFGFLMGIWIWTFVSAPGFNAGTATLPTAFSTAAWFSYSCMLRVLGPADPFAQFFTHTSASRPSR